MAQTLMIYDGTTGETAPGLRTGGIPLVPVGFSWPRCATCEGAMQFLAQLPVDDGTVAVFICANDPGLCEEWDPFDGGNRAYLFPSGTSGGLVPATVLAEGETQLGAVSAVKTVTVEEDTYDDARSAYAELCGRGRAVLGSLGGEPDWYYADRAPDCPECEKPMAFVAHLEEGNETATAANYGGGLGYVLTCAPCTWAVFLTQS
ncbi:hypothetical protein ACN24K_10150 [Streptomyces microflavus]